MANHTIDTIFAEPPPKGQEGRPRIPLDILTKLRFSVAVPEYVVMDDSSFPVSLRMRTEEMPTDDCERLRFTDFTIDVEQSEKYRSSPSSQYKHRYPLPPKSDQPPHKPLLNPHPVQAIYDLGLGAHLNSAPSCSRQFSLLSDDVSGLYNVEGHGYAFLQDADASRNNTWYALKTDVPFVHVGREKDVAPCTLRESLSGPLFAVSHRLYVAITCTYDLTAGEHPERATERLHFHIPLHFARVLSCVPGLSRDCTPSPPLSGHSPSASTDSIDSTALLLRDRLPAPSLPYAQTLPAYSQLFDVNGDRKIDYSVPLPAYTPPMPSLDGLGFTSEEGPSMEA